MVGSHDVFVNLPLAFRLSAESIYRLHSLGGGSFRWQEETLTEILLGHLTGMDYRIDAPCPCAAQHCAHWNSGDKSTIRGSRLGLLTRHREAQVGADFVLAVQGVRAQREARLLVQAKKIPFRSGATLQRKALERRKPGRRSQFDSLLAAARLHGGAPYYLFYPDRADPHATVPIACRRHARSAVATSAVLVHARHIQAAFGNRQSADVLDILRAGRTLECLAEHSSSSAQDRDFEAALNMVRLDDVDYSGCELGTPPPDGSWGPATSFSNAKTVRRKSSRHVGHVHSEGPISTGTVARSLTGLRKGDVLAIHLGKVTEDVPQTPATSNRTHYGWWPGISQPDLREATRMYWGVNPKKADNVKYLVAMRKGAAIEAYRVIGEPITHTAIGKVEFQVSELRPRDGPVRDDRECRRESPPSTTPIWTRLFVSRPVGHVYGPTATCRGALFDPSILSPFNPPTDVGQTSLNPRE